MIKLSVVIANLNTKKLTLECIESIYKQDLPFPFEVIVVDDGSNDGSVEALAEIEKERKNFKFIANKKNSGYAKANNKGLKVAKGEYWLLLNSDTIVKKNALENLIKFADETPDAGVVGSKLYNADGSLQPSCFRFPTITNAILEYWFGRKGLFEKFAPDPPTGGEEAVEVNAVVGAVFLITPKAKKRVGMLDERYWAYFEDIDYCRQTWKRGLKVYYLPKSEIIHYHGASFKKLADEKNRWKKLIPSSKIYHGVVKHYILTLIILIGQKWRKIIWVVLVILLTIPAFWNLLRPGLFSMQDDLQAFRIYEMDRCFDDGQIPCRWVPDAGYRYGYPQFNFYPPSVYYVGALFHRVGFQYIDTVKILFIFGYVISALTMFILVDSLLGKWPAFVSSLLYTYVPYKAVEVYVRGAMSEFWALAFFPMVFWAIYQFIKTERKKYFIWFSISIALLITTHNLTTLIFAPFAVIWTIYWIIAERKWKIWSRIALSGLLGIGLAAFYFLPVLFERKFVHVESMLSGYFDYRQHFVSLYKIFISREWGYGSSGFPNELLNLSTGIVQWLMGIVAFFLGVVNYKREKKLSLLLLIFVAAELFVLFMMHMKSSFIWARLPVLWWLQFPWRFLSVSVFLLSLLAGLAMHLSFKAKYIFGGFAVLAALIINIGFFVPKDWLMIKDSDKFSGLSWEKQMTISIFDYLPIYAKLPPITEAPDLPEILDGEAKISDYQKGSNFQTGKVEVVDEATIRLPLFDFPGMQVKANGQVVKHNHDDCRGEEFCLGLITFKLPEGNYKVEAKLTDTIVRKVGNYLTLTSIIVLIWLIIKKNEKADE